LPAPFLSSAPISLDIAAPPPIPRPFAIASAIKKKGKTKPTAARASEPIPETQIASVKLYIVVTDIAIIMGIASLMMAFLGSPSNVWTPFVSLLFVFLEMFDRFSAKFGFTRREKNVLYFNIVIRCHSSRDEKCVLFFL